jgi:glycosyltransferase involved in cell wall biosynthesis
MTVLIIVEAYPYLRCLVLVSDRLLFLLEHPSDRNLLIEKGKQQVQKFSWEKTAMQTVNVYRSLT